MRNEVGMGFLVALLFFDSSSVVPPSRFAGGGRQETDSPFEAKRVSRRASITLQAPLKEVFPLFGPIEEKKWAPDWNPEIIYSTTNLVDEYMVFRTQPARQGTEVGPTWIVSKYIPEQAFIEYTVFTPERVWWITIQCSGSGATTSATITYTCLGLTDEGNAIAQTALDRTFSHDLKDWEGAINHYLRAGEPSR